MKKRPQSSTASSPADSNLIRLQRVLASAGLGSRRDCEALITEGRVEVDGQPCTQLGTRVDPETQDIRVDGEKIRGQKLQYFMLNKPAGVLSTNEDPDGRTRVVDLIKTDLRVYNVGRLDQSSEGLIIVTNDGDLAYRLTHPKFGVEKRYLVQCIGFPTLEQLQQLERGVYLAEGKAKVERVSIKKKHRLGAILEMVLTEGRNREIRRVLASIGHKVTRLKRIAIGPLQLGELAVGAHRRLTLDEIKALKKAAAAGTARPAVKKPAGSTGPARTLGQLKAAQERTASKSRPQKPSGGRGRAIDRQSGSSEAFTPSKAKSRTAPRGGKFGSRNNKFGARADSAGPRRDATGPRRDATGPRRDATGPRRDATGPRRDATGPRRDATGPRSEGRPRQAGSGKPRFSGGKGRDAKRSPRRGKGRQ